MKALVKKAFAVCGFEIHRRKRSTNYESMQNNRDSMAGLLQHMVKLGFAPRTVIDVGVAKGTPELYQTFPHAFHLLVEPLKEFEPQMLAILQNYSGKHIIAAAGSSSGTITINVHTEHLSGSSILKETDGAHEDGIPREVKMINLDDLCQENELKGTFVLKVDVQGAELEVLNGCQEILSDTELVLLEVSMFQFLEDAPQIYEVITYMKNRGFVVYDIYGRLDRPFDGALAQKDIAFVKENGVFRKYHFYGENETARREMSLELSSL